MIIYDFIYQANAGRRKRARIELARRYAAGFCVVATAASVGVIIGILIAPKSGEETIANLRKKATKSVDAIEKAIKERY